MSKDSKWQPPAAGGLAFMLVALVVIFTALGYWLDRWLHTSPWLMVAGVFVGAGLGFTYLVLTWTTSAGNRESKDHRDEGDGPEEGPS